MHFSFRSLLLSALTLTFASATASAHQQEIETERTAAVSTVAKAEPPASTSLPDAPSFGLSSSIARENDPQRGQNGTAAATTQAGKYDRLILPTEHVARLSGGEKILYSMKEQFSVIQLPAVLISAAASHVVDSAPHYGTNSTAFAQRVGASAARQTVQTLTTDGVFAAAFHDDPHYYVMGYGKPFKKRVLYAATRVLVTRADDGHQRFNAPIFAGYAVAAAVNNAYYPERDQNATTATRGYFTSLAGAALGFEAREFFEDAMNLFRHKQ